jgi:hypothetical protein
MKKYLFAMAFLASCAESIGAPPHNDADRTPQASQPDAGNPPDLRPDATVAPPGCPPAQPLASGIGAPCSRSGGECELTTGNCTCDDYDWHPLREGDPPAVNIPAKPGTPCFCDRVTPSACTDGAVAVAYTIHLWPTTPLTACVPPSCATIDLSR